MSQPPSSSRQVELGVISQLHQWDGSGPARHPTRVATAWDEEGLAVVFTCRDRDAWATHRTRDAPLWQEEVVELFLAPGSADPTRYFELELNPLGALFDAVVDNPDSRRDTMKVDTSWDCPGLRWRVAALASDQDWQAFWWIPFEGLGTPALAEWRANFYRIERPRPPAPAGDEFAAWCPTLTAQPDFHQPRHFGHLRLLPAGHEGLADGPDGLPRAHLLEVPHLRDHRLAPEIVKFCQSVGKTL